jgi:hypothetical protein
VATAKDLNDLDAFLVAGEAGDYVFRQGDEGGDLFLITRGQVELLQEGSGEARRLASLEAGDSFGEAQAFRPGPRTCSARGVTDYQALRLDRASLAQIVSEDASVALGMLERLAVRPPQVMEPGPAPSGAAEEAAPQSTGAEVSAPVGEPCLSLADGTATFPLLGKEEFIVGRLDRATGFAPDVDLTTHDNDRALSRRHAQIVIRDDKVIVREEKGSRNGTFVNGTRLETGDEIELEVGTKVRFGLVEMVFERR